MRFKSLQGRIMKIIFISFGIMTVFFVSATIILLHLLHVRIDNIEVQERELVESRSHEAMMNLATDSLNKTIIWAADQIDDEFFIFTYATQILGEQVKDVLSAPSDYRIKPINRPSMDKDGTYSLQFLYPAGYNTNNSASIEKLGRLANLEPTMREIVRGNEGYTTFDCYIALPDGGTIAMDKHSGNKIEPDGTIRDYDPRTREWYQGAVSTGKIFFTEDIDSIFYNKKEITWGLPIYADGELSAVIEGCSFMDLFERKLSERNIGETGFSVLISDKGHIVYSPRPSGALAQDADNTTDVRTVASPSLADAVQKGLDQETGFAEVDLDGAIYYTAYAPVDTIGWTLMMFVSAEEVERPSQNLMQQMSVISSDNMLELDKHIKLACFFLIIILFAIIALSCHVISVRTKRALQPIKVMTDTIQNIDKEHMTFEVTDIYKTDNEIQFLAEEFSSLSQRVQIYMNEIVEKTAVEERLNAEIDTASKIQLAMLPGMTEEITAREEFDIYAKMVPAKQVGGDLYDYFLIDDNHLAFVIGDVSGKGISAALFMVLAKNTIQNQLMTYGTDLETAISETNRLLIRDNDMNLFVTVWVGVLTLDTGTLRFVDGGHELAAISSNRGEFDITMDEHSVLLGMIDDIEYKLNTIKLNDGDTIYLYTDGIVEAKDSDDNMYGKERMLEALNENPTLSVEELDDVVRAKVDEFVKDAEQFDDITSVCVRYYKKN